VFSPISKEKEIPTQSCIESIHSVGGAAFLSDIVEIILCSQRDEIRQRRSKGSCSFKGCGIAVYFFENASTALD